MTPAELLEQILAHGVSRITKGGRGIDTQTEFYVGPDGATAQVARAEIIAAVGPGAKWDGKRALYADGAAGTWMHADEFTLLEVACPLCGEVHGNVGCPGTPERAGGPM